MGEWGAMEQKKVRAERSDKKMRLYPYVDQETTGKNLKMIHTAVSQFTDISIHDMTEEALDVLALSADFIEWIQDKYKVPQDHPLRVKPIYVNGKVAYLKHLFDA